MFIQAGLDKVMKLNPVTYEFKQTEPPSTKQQSIAIQKPKQQLGFLAQEVANIIPQAVDRDDKGWQLFNYSAIIPLLTKSVQESSAEVDSLISQVAELKRKVAVNATGNGNEVAVSNASGKRGAD